MKYSLSLIVLFFFVAAQGFSDDDSDVDSFLNPGETEFDYEAPLDGRQQGTEIPVFPSETRPTRPEPNRSSQPIQRPTPMSTGSAEVSRVHPSLRSQNDPNHPFFELQYSTVDPNSRITGKPLTICEMLETVSSPQTRCQLLHAYWALAGELAKYKIAQVKQAQLSDWARKLGPTNTVLQAATKHAIAQRQTQELLVILKQTEFAALLRQTGFYKPVVQANLAAVEQLPIPCDLPFIGTYQTHVNQLVQYRPGSNLVLLDKTIVLRRQIFESKFEEFNAIDELFKAIQGSDTSVESLIQTNHQYFATYVECIDAIIAYNETIAEYVALAVGPEISGRRLLMTLIQLNPESPEPTEDPADSAPVIDR